MEQPSRPFTVEPGVKTKKTLVLYTTDTLANDERHDAILEVVLRAYAVDANDTISVQRDIRFTYPKAGIIRKKMQRD